MRNRLLALAVVSVTLVALWMMVGGRVRTAEAQAKPGAGFAAIPGTVGGQDTFGAYDIVKGWPKDISTLPGNEKWTWGAGRRPASL